MNTTIASCLLRIINNLTYPLGAKFAEEGGGIVYFQRFKTLLIYLSVISFRYIPEKQLRIFEYKRDIVRTFRVDLFGEKTFAFFPREGILSAYKPAEIIYICRQNYVYINLREYIHKSIDLYTASDICLKERKSTYEYQT